MRLMIPCTEMARLVSRSLDRRLRFSERIALRMHLALCEGCSNFERQMKFLREAVRQLGETDDRRGAGRQST